MELTLEYFDKVNESYFRMEKERIQGFHQYMKCENLNILKESINEYLKNSVAILGLMDKEVDIITNIVDVNKLFRQREIDVTGIVHIVEKVSKTVNKSVDDFNFMMKDIYSDDIAAENYINATALYTNETLIHMCEESLFILSSLESMHIVTEADNTEEDNKPGVKSTGENNNNVKSKESISAKGKRIASNIWQKLKDFFKRIRDMFINKINSLRKRDSGWLKDNKSKIANINTDGVIIDVYSDIDKGFSGVGNQLSSITNKLNNLKLDENIYENSKKITDKYRDSNGNLRQGTMNFMRSGNAKNEPKLISIKGSQISTTLSKMHSYCEEYLAKYKSLEKVIQDGEKRITKMEQGMKYSNVATESYSLIEDDLYINTDLFLCENFNVLLEAGETGVRNDNISNENGSRAGGGSATISNLTKVVRDEQIIANAAITVLEQKYFEYIKILRTMLK